MATNSIHFDLVDSQFEIPLSLNSLQAFRAWITADDAPAEGRIDYINGRIEVDMSPEDLYTHGTLKVRMAGILDTVVHQKN